MIVPRETFVLVELEQPRISDIIDLPEDTSAQRPARGVVRAIGPLVTAVRAGDKVHFEKFDWCVAQYSPMCIIIEEQEILAKEG